MNNFVTRTISATVYAGLVVGSLLLSPVCFRGYPLLFAVLMMVVSVLAVREFHALVESDIQVQTYAMVASALLFTTAYFGFYGDPISWKLLIGYVGILLLLLVTQLFRANANAIESWGNICAGQLMVALPFALMNGVLSESRWMMLALFVLIWVNDSGAYIVGSLMAKRKGGNHKMFARVSPAKSWEGLIGGFVFDLVAGYVFYKVGWTSEMGLWQSMLFALVVGVAGTLGDLMESLFKRTLGVKDSGKIMPGHGGVLDRFDSLLLAVPVAYFLFVLL